MIIAGGGSDPHHPAGVILGKTRAQQAQGADDDPGVPPDRETVSMGVVSAWDDEYMLRTVASGDGDRSLWTPLTRYYKAEGTPPGGCGL